jgi:hypothetical protein
MTRSRTSLLHRLFGLLVLATIVCAPAVQAQVARIAGVQRIVEKRNGANPWNKIGSGAALGVGDSVRTGKRSKVDLKFADGSLIRLGALSSIEIQSAKGVRLSNGELLFSALRPGRILAGTGTAEIRGSVGIIVLQDDGDADFTLFSGAMDVTANGNTVDVPPGRSITANLVGVLSGLRVAAPFGFAGGSYRPDLLEEPEDAPFVGSVLNERIRNAPERTTLDQILPRANPITIPATGFGEPGRVPIPTPFPPDPLSRATSPTLVQRLEHQRIASRLMQSIPANQSTLDAQIAPAADVVVNDVAFDLDTGAAFDHLKEVDREKGQTSGGNAAAVAALSDGGIAVYGAHLRGFGARGKFYLQGTVLPLRLRTSNGTSDYSSLGNTFLTYRDTWGEVQVGRQRFLSGPTQASTFGSLVRQGGRETMDAIRFAPRLDGGRQLEVAYIYDAFPRNLPYQFSGAQKAFYGRAALRRRDFNLGLNAFKYSTAPIANTTGVTLDLAVPLLRDEIELYGEAGRDAFRRRLAAVGLSFPGLYERTGFDAFLEHANLGDSSSLAAPPSETTLRVYRRIGKRLNTVSVLNHYGSGAGWNFTFGLAFGVRAGRHDAQ